MKTKLLKKVRKRFEIVHMPKGFESSGDIYEFNLFKLNDSTNPYYERYAQLKRKPDVSRQFCDKLNIYETEKECIEHLKRCIISRLRSEGHRGVRDKKLSKTHKKVWHV
jgi:hypothetical protein